MKKKMYLLFGLIMSLLLVGVVKAAGPYFLDFDTEKYNDRRLGLNVEYDGGYLSTDLTEDGTMITTYSKTGEVIKEKELDEEEVLDIAIYNKNIYLLLYNSDDGVYYIKLYDETLTKKAEVEVTGNYPYGNVYQFYKIHEIEATADALILNNFFEGKIITYKTDLTNPNTTSITQEEALEKWPLMKYQSILENKYNDPTLMTIDYSNKLYAVGIWDSSTAPACVGSDTSHVDHGGDNPPTTSTGRSECDIVEVALFDDKGNKKWGNNLPEEFFGITEVRIMHEHVVAIAAKASSMEIRVYDFNGNLLQSISSDLGYQYLEETEKGMIVGQGYCPTINVITSSGYSPASSIQGETGPGNINVEPYIAAGCCTLVGSRGAGTTCKVNHQVYYLYREITPTVTTGKGEIKVANRGIPGEPVEVEIIPAEGYILGVVRVTDAKGNVVEYHENKFTMPSADVTIEVEFLAKNAKTADIAITIAILIAIISAGIVFVQYRKLHPAK